MNTIFHIIIYLSSATAIFAQQISVFDTGNSGLPDNTIRAISKALDGTLWVGTDWGLARLKNGEWESYYASNAGLPDNSIRSIAIDPEGRIWIGTFFGGVAILENDTVTAVYNTFNSPLPDNHVRSIAIDSAGAWIGTLGGLAYLSDTVWQVYTTSNSILRSNNISCIHIDGLHRVWAGTVNGGLIKIEDSAWTLYYTGNSGLPDNTLLGLAHDSENNIWMASPAAGVIAFNGTAWQSFNNVNSSSPTNSYNGIAVIHDIIHLSSLQNGLVIYNGSVNWEQYHTGNTALPEDELLCIEPGDSGCLWLGTLSKGLVKFCMTDSTSSVSNAGTLIANVFPIPATSHLNVQFSNNVFVARINIFDNSGRIIHMNENIYFKDFAIPLNNYSDGIYFLEIITSETREIIQFMKSGGE